MSSTFSQKQFSQFDESAFLSDVTAHLQVIYPHDYQSIANRVLEVASKYQPFSRVDARPRWDEQDVLLITYGDSLGEDDQAPLATLYRFLSDYLSDTISGVHILPFFPYSSDDGFSLIFYCQVNP